MTITEVLSRVEPRDPVLPRMARRVNHPEIADRLSTQGVKLVVIDLEGTLNPFESADEFAARFLEPFSNCEHENAGLAKFNQIQSLTKQGMNGEISFAESARKRWGLIAPTKQELLEYGRSMEGRHTPHAAEFIAALYHVGKKVRIMTGGFSPFAQEVGRQLDVPQEHVVSNHMVFDRNGRFERIDEERSTVMNGKGGPCKDLISELNMSEEDVVVVGDGFNDLTAHIDYGLAVVGFGGVVTRPIMRSQSPVYLEPQRSDSEDNAYGSLASVLGVICTPDELQKISYAFPYLTEHMKAAA